MSAECNSNQPSTSNGPNSSCDVSESRLGVAFEAAASETLERFLSSFKIQFIKKNFPEIYKECKTEVIELFKDLQNQLETSITSDVKVLCNDTTLFSSLKSLDDRITKYHDRAGKDSWRPSGNPENDMRDHIYILKQRSLKILQFILETSFIENNKLETIVEQNHGEILELKKEIDNVNQEVQRDLCAANSLDFQSLSKDIYTMFGKN